MSATGVVVGRQPIFNRELEVVAYELLFRPVQDGGAASPDGDAMTTEVLYGALNIGVDRLVGDKKIFCNADRGVLTGVVPLPLPPERTVVEVLESVTIDPDVEAGCRALRARGFALAMDDFVWFDGAERLLADAAVVKIDVRQLSADEVAETAARCRPFGTQLLAEKVETAAELAAFHAQGFDLFQGYALAHPVSVRAAALDATTLGVLRMSEAVLDERTDIEDLVQIVRGDPALALQLIEVASIGAPGELRRPVRSIREALVLLGTQRLRAWITLLQLRSAGTTAADDVLTVLARARMCELVALRDGRENTAFGFTAGMISALDRLLGLPPQQLTEILPLSRPLLDASFGVESSMGQLVQRVIAYEAGGAADQPDRDTELPGLAAQALEWAGQSLTALSRSWKSPRSAGAATGRGHSKNMSPSR